MFEPAPGAFIAPEAVVGPLSVADLHFSRAASAAAIERAAMAPPRSVKCIIV